MIASSGNNTGNAHCRALAPCETPDGTGPAGDYLRDDVSGPIAIRDGGALKGQLNQVLFQQARARLPTTYARLAEQVAFVKADEMNTIRNLLEQLMEDDAARGRPLLAAVAVSSFKTGLPSSWFFSKAESIGLFAGDPTNLEAYAFHARELHNVIRFYADPRLSPKTEKHLQPTALKKGNRMLIAKDIMTSSIVTVRLDSTVAEVADVLESYGISGVPVIDNGVLCGIVSEGDLLRRMEIGTDLQLRPWWFRLFSGNAVLATDYIKSHSVHVTDVMTTDVVTVTETTAVVDIINLLERKRIRRVPVVRDGQVVGIVSRADLVKAINTSRKNSHPPVLNDDSRIRSEILDALRSESWPSDENASVTVNNGVVTFWGAYASEAERKASHILAENITGVRAIDDHRIPLTIPYGMM